MIAPDGDGQIDSQVVNVGDRVSMECIVTGLYLRFSIIIVLFTSLF